MLFFLQKLFKRFIMVVTFLKTIYVQVFYAKWATFFLNNTGIKKKFICLHFWKTINS